MNLTFSLCKLVNCKFTVEGDLVRFVTVEDAVSLVSFLDADKRSM